MLRAIAISCVWPGELIVSELPLIKVQLTAEGDILGQFDTHRQEFVSPTLILALNQLADIDLFKFYSLADSCSINIAEERGIKSQNFKGKYYHCYKDWFSFINLHNSIISFGP